MYLCPTWVAACCPPPPPPRGGLQQYLRWLGIWVVCVTFPGYASWSAVRACLVLEFCGILLWDYVCCVILPAVQLCLCSASASLSATHCCLLCCAALIVLVVAALCQRLSSQVYPRQDLSDRNTCPGHSHLPEGGLS